MFINFFPYSLLQYNGHEALYKVQGLQHNDLTYTSYEMITTVSLVSLYHKTEDKRKRKVFLFDEALGIYSNNFHI